MAITKRSCLLNSPTDSIISEPPSSFGMTARFFHYTDTESSDLESPWYVPNGISTTTNALSTPLITLSVMII